MSRNRASAGPLMAYVLGAPKSSAIISSKVVFMSCSLWAHYTRRQGAWQCGGLNGRSARCRALQSARLHSPGVSMNLLVRTNLALGGAFILATGTLSYVCSRLLDANARQELVQQAGLMLDSAVATREYTTEE